MTRRFNLCASVAAVMLLAAPIYAHSFSFQNQGRNSSQAQSADSKTVAGKVTSIGGDRKSFTMEVDNGGSKQNMQFLIDANTQVTGRVTTGSVANVQYQPKDGQNLALVISPQNPQ